MCIKGRSKAVVTTHRKKESYLAAYGPYQNRCFGTARHRLHRLTNAKRWQVFVETERRLRIALIRIHGPEAGGGTFR